MHNHNYICGPTDNSLGTTFKFPDSGPALHFKIPYTHMHAFMSKHIHSCESVYTSELMCQVGIVM